MRYKSTEDRAYHEIIQRIISQKYPPGTSIVESQLAEELGMSRTPIRNALRYLVANGFLENPTNKSCIVPTISGEDINNVFELRFLIEPTCAYLAATKARANSLAFFTDLLEQEEHGCCKSNSEIEEINREIHFGIAELTGNPYYKRALSPIFWRCQLYLFFFDTFYSKKAPNKAKTNDEHSKLINAIFSNDAEESKKLMQAHIESTYKMLTTNRYLAG